MGNNWKPEDVTFGAFLSCVIGGALTFFSGPFVGMVWEKPLKYSVTTAIAAALFLLATVSILGYGIVRMFGTRWWTTSIVLGIPAVLVGFFLVRHVKRVRGLPDAYAALWPVCVERRGIPEAAALAPIGTGIRPIIIYNDGHHFEPRTQWLPKDLASTQLVGRAAELWPDHCVIDVREARTAKTIGRAKGCRAGIAELVPLVEPLER